MSIGIFTKSKFYFITRTLHAQIHISIFFFLNIKRTFPIYLPIYYHEDGRHRQNTAQLFAFPTQADKTEAITGQVAYHILSVVKQKPSGRTKCKIKMNWNLK